MKISTFLTGYWHFNLFAVILAGILVVFHLVTNKNASKSKQVLYYSGIILLLLVTNSPVSFLAHGYLFSIHMIAHITLLLIVPPMLLAGINPVLLEKLHQSAFRRTGEILFTAPVAWLSGMAAMYIWHIPALFGAMEHSQVLHNLEILSLVILGIVFIWPVYSPISWKRLEPLQSALYLFIACTGCTVLGILITFAPPSLYIPYMHGHNDAVWELIRNNWGISPAVDQQAGGLIMWVPACLIYVTNIMLILAGFFNQPYTGDD